MYHKHCKWMTLLHMEINKHTGNFAFLLVEFLENAINAYSSASKKKNVKSFLKMIETTRFDEMIIWTSGKVAHRLRLFPRSIQLKSWMVRVIYLQNIIFSNDYYLLFNRMMRKYAKNGKKLKLHFKHIRYSDVKGCWIPLSWAKK